MIKTLLFSDSHVEPDQDLTRFDALGELIIQERPDYIIDMGDSVSLSSISHWDMNKKLKMEGERYKADIDAGRESYDRLFRPLEKLQRTFRKQKSKIYRPQFDKMDGNHEGWVDRYLEQNPSMSGYINLSRDLGLTERGIIPYPYRERLFRHAINYMHAPLAGNDQPISGLHVPYKALGRFNNHIAFGHYHRFEVATTRRTDHDSPIRAISCPCFFDGQPHYLSPNAPCAINRGVLLITQDESLFPVVKEISIEGLLNGLT